VIFICQKVFLNFHRNTEFNRVMIAITDSVKAKFHYASWFEAGSAVFAGFMAERLIPPFSPKIAHSHG